MNVAKDLMVLQSEGGRSTLPEGWQRIDLGEIAEIVAGITLGRRLQDQQTRRVPYLRVANVKDGYLDLSNVKEIEATETEIEKYRLQAGDLLLTEGGDADKLGRGTYWQGQIPECIHQNHIFRARLPQDQFLPAFVSAQIGSPYGKSYFLKHAKQTTGIATINRQVLNAFPLLYPPLGEQETIANQLAAKLSAVEKARAASEARLAAADDLLKAHLREIFSKTNRQHWNTALLGDIAEIASGLQKTPSRKPIKNYFPYLTVRNVQQGYLDLSKVESFEITQEELKRIKLEEKDILIVEGNGSIDQIGRNAIFEKSDGNWIHQNHIIRVRLDQKICNPEFVGWLLNSDFGRSQLIEKARTSSGLYTLSTKKVSSLQIHFPSIDEQNLIVTTIRKKKSYCEKVLRNIKLELSSINELPASYLKQVFGVTI